MNSLKSLAFRSCRLGRLRISLTSLNLAIVASLALSVPAMGYAAEGVIEANAPNKISATVSGDGSDALMPIETKPAPGGRDPVEDRPVETRPGPDAPEDRPIETRPAPGDLDVPKEKPIVLMPIDPGNPDDQPALGNGDSGAPVDGNAPSLGDGMNDNTLADANAYTDSKAAEANHYTDTQTAAATANANRYTDQRFDALSETIDQFRGDVNRRFQRQDARINRLGAMSAAMSQMVMSSAGLQRTNYVGVGVGVQNGRSALALGYSRAVSSNLRVSFGGSVSGNEASAGAGLAVGW